MSPWEPNLGTPDLTSASAPEGVERNSARRSGARASFPLWAKLTPFFMSAVLFLSAFFAAFAPLPILMISLQKGRRWGWFAALTNGAFVLVLGGLPSLALYSVFILALALGLVEGLLRFRKIERAAALSWVLMTAVGASWVLFHFHGHLGEAWHRVGHEVEATIDTLVQSLSPDHLPPQLSSPEEIREWKSGMVAELPSAVAIATLVLTWVSLVITLRLNPGAIRQRLGLTADFFRRWKSPEWLVWPTIASGAVLVIGGILEPATVPALNLFKVLMTIYGLHGLSVMAYFFDLWGLRGLLRTVGYVLVTLIMTPLILSLGFFDLWFDFRSKFRQS